MPQGDLVARATGGSPDLPEANVFTTMAGRLDTSARHFPAMADRLLPRSAPSIGYGGKARVVPHIWHVFMGWSPFARAVKHVALDTSAPRFAAMADRLLPQGAPSIGHGGEVGALPRIWYVFIWGRHPRER